MLSIPFLGYSHIQNFGKNFLPFVPSGTRKTKNQAWIQFFNSLSNKFKKQKNFGSEINLSNRFAIEGPFPEKINQKEKWKFFVRFKKKKKKKFLNFFESEISNQKILFSLFSIFEKILYKIILCLDSRLWWLNLFEFLRLRIQKKKTPKFFLTFSRKEILSFLFFLI